MQSKLQPSRTSLGDLQAPVERGSRCVLCAVSAQLFEGCCLEAEGRGGFRLRRVPHTGDSKPQSRGHLCGSQRGRKQRGGGWLARRASKISFRCGILDYEGIRRLPESLHMWLVRWRSGVTRFTHVTQLEGNLLMPC